MSRPANTAIMARVTCELEICCYTVAGALTAQRAGADRIELCAGEPEGGTTPSLGALEVARQHVTIPVFPMVRPRGGTFVFDQFELAQMLHDAERIAMLGFPGLVIGALDADGWLATDQLAALIARARAVNPDISITFHRAFDAVSDPLAAFSWLRGEGVDRILTSGQQPTAVDGIALISELAMFDGPAIMPGGGVRPDNVEQFVAAGVTNVHSSASTEPGAGVSADLVEALAQLVH